MNLQGGVELLNDSLVPILLELENPSLAHNSKEVDETAHVHEELQLRPTQPPLLCMHRPDIYTSLVQHVLAPGEEEGSRRIPSLSKVSRRSHLTKLGRNPAEAFLRDS